MSDRPVLDNEWASNNASPRLLLLFTIDLRVWYRRSNTSTTQTIGELLIGKRRKSLSSSRVSRLDGMLMAWIARVNRPQNMLCHPTSSVSFGLASSFVVVCEGSVDEG